MTIQDINQKIQDIQTALSANPEGRAKELLEQGLQTFQSLLLAEQKKSESQTPVKSEQQEQRTEAEEIQLAMQQRDEMLKTKKWEKIRKALSKPMGQLYDESIKTVKAPEFSVPDELINIELEDSKGNKQVKTFSKAQVRALTRKYFSNVHESWLGKDRKMGVGFKNLLAYVVAWKEFDGEVPQPSQILPYYDRYKQGEKASDAFKVAQELYEKIVEILQA